MGCGSSTKNWIPVRTNGPVSAFYWSCRNGDIATVEKMLPNLTYEQVNQVEPNGSTALHAACFYNHPHIVQLLLSSGCSRTTLNRYGVTAYQETTTHEIRALFDRPPSNRFVDDNFTKSFQLIQSNSINSGNHSDKPDDRVKGYTSVNSAHEAKFMIAMANSTNPLKKIVTNEIQTKSIEDVDRLVSRVIPYEHKERFNVNMLFKKFTSRMGITHLLTMYTLQTPLYKALQNDADSLTVLIYLHLHELQDRAFQGRVYRGAIMTQDDINAYRWAFDRLGYVLETRIFQSTSLDKSVAQSFAQGEQLKSNITSFSVLLTLDFPQKCPTAINLTKISGVLPALSAYENEEEVLVLPFTLFSVKEIKIDSESRQYRITLMNVPTPNSGLFDAAKNVT